MRFAEIDKKQSMRQLALRDIIAEHATTITWLEADAVDAEEAFVAAVAA
jgi:hypothetical protein